MSCLTCCRCLRREGGKLDILHNIAGGVIIEAGRAAQKSGDLA